MVKLKSAPKRKLFALLSCFFVAVVGVSGIGAYLTDADSTSNLLPMGENKIEIVEEFDPPEEIIPGTTFTKDVKVRNTGTVDCYVRIMAVLSDSRMEPYCEIDWNETDWAHDAQDGYYYYTQRLPVSDESPSLMTTVKIKDDAPEEVLTGFRIIIYAESYQSYGFANYQDAWANYQNNRPQ